MKQVMLSAVVSLTFMGAFASPGKNGNNNSNELANFSSVMTLIPSSIKVDKYKFIDMTDMEDNPDSYDVRLYGKHFEGDILYDENYNIVSYKEEVKDTRLTDNVVNAIETKYPGSRFTKDIEIISDDQSVTDEYKVYFVTGTKHGVALVEADGKIIRSRE